MIVVRCCRACHVVSLHGTKSGERRMSYVDGDTTHSPIKATCPELFETLQYLVAKIPTIRINIQSILGPGFFIDFSFDFF